MPIEEILGNLKGESYYKSMKYLSRVYKEKSPIGKMKIIVKASENILKSINTFYKKYNFPDCTYIDGDDLMGLFSFICCKCMLFELNTHLEIINRFVTSNLLSSVSGYYLITLQAVL